MADPTETLSQRQNIMAKSRTLERKMPEYPASFLPLVVVGKLAVYILVNRARESSHEILQLRFAHAASPAQRSGVLSNFISRAVYYAYVWLAVDSGRSSSANDRARQCDSGPLTLVINWQAAPKK